MMTRSAAWRLGVIGLGMLVAGVGVWITSSLASAGNAVVAVDSTKTGVGFEATVQLEALDVNAPGLGAWTIDITYDPAVLTPIDCDASHGGICNTAYGADRVRVVGVSTFGILGSTTLGSIVFSCDELGASELGIVLNVLADATLGEPLPIDAAVQNGVLTCSAEAPPPTPSPAPTPGGEALDGDVNCDGEVDSVDAALILQYGVGFIDELLCPENGDINGDGRIDAVDASLILQIVAGFI